MNRFWMFPLVLGLVGVLFPVVVLVEGMAPILPMMLATFGPTYSVSHEIGSVFTSSAPWGFGVFMLLGIGFGVWNLLRNGRTERRGSQLIGNLAWCLLYAHAFIIVNSTLVWLWISRGSSGISVAGVAAFLPALFCFVAILWGTIRAIKTDDVLSPRVLLAKLRRSARVEG